MSNILGNLKAVWNQAGPVHRMTLIGIVLGFVLVAGLLVYWASQPDLALLYGGLSSQDAARISDRLRDEDIPFKIRDGGTAILVPSDKVYALRLMMVNQGLPEGGNEGYSILDNSELGMSPFKESVNYIRAIAGELSKTIKMMDGVTAARVQVVSDRGNRLSRRSQDAKASVFIKTGSGRKLSAANVAAVTNLVAGAVPGVTPEKVKVIVNGKTEAGLAKDPLTAVSGNLLNYKMKMERYLSEKAEQQLAIVLGPGRCSVRVDVALSTATTQSTENKIDPTGYEIETETKNKAVTGGGRGNSSPGGSTKDKTEKISYERSRTVTQKVDSPGRVETKAVAVFVDLSAAAGGGEEGKAPAKKLAIKDIEEIVRNAIGLNLQKGDSIKVVDVAFQSVAATDLDTPVEEAGMFSSDFLLEIAKRSSLGLLVIGMLVAFKILSGRKAKAVAAESSGEGESSEAGGGGGGGAARNIALKGADKQLRSKIVRTLQSNPSEVKQLFVSWIESNSGK